MSAAWQQLKSSVEQGRLGHAYIITGNPYGQGSDLAARLSQLLFEDEDNEHASMAQVKKHPDLRCIEPQSKSRTILVANMDEVMTQLHQTSFRGGYKIAIIFEADRLSEQSANKFLKTLEEPPGKSLILLLTQHPERLMPTIVSRCQTIRLLEKESISLAPEIVSAMEEILLHGAPRDGLSAFAMGAKLLSVFETVYGIEQEALEEEIGEQEIDEKVLEARIEAKARRANRSVLTLMQHWFRDLYLIKSGLDLSEDNLHFSTYRLDLQRQAESLPLLEIQKWIDETEGMARRNSGTIPIKMAVEAGLHSC